MAQGPGEVDGIPGRPDDATPTAATAAPSADDIRSQIEQTRAEMSDTIDAIQTRFHPSRVIVDAKDAITDAAVGRVKRLAERAHLPRGSMRRTLRDHPWPVVLATAVAAGLLARALRTEKRGDGPLPASGVHKRRRNRRARSARLRARNTGLVAAASAGAAWWVVTRALGTAPNSQMARRPGSDELRPAEQDNIGGTNA
jgi:hypothetical protein